MSQAPLVSIIVGVYNCEQLLPATLRSIQDQSWQDWECILVDDGSTDRTPEIAREYAGQDPRFRAITQKNTGTCGARNRGYAESNPGSRYVTFMDHDDVWLPGALNSLVASAEANPALAGAHGLSDYIDEKGAPLLPGKFASHGRERIGLGEDGRMKEWDFTKPTSFRMLLMRNTVFPPGVLLTRRAFYEKAGLFDPAMALVEDWDLLLRLSRFGDFAFLNEVVVYYRRHRNNLSSQSDERNKRKIRQLQEKNFRSPDNTPEQAEIARKTWRYMQVESFRAKWRKCRECAAASDFRGAGMTLARMYAEVHRYLRGYPTARGL